MKRYLVTSLTFGLLVAALVVALQMLGVYEPIDSRFDQWFKTWQLYPDAASISRFPWAEIFVTGCLCLGICGLFTDISQVAQRFIVLLVFFFVVLGISPVLALYGIFFAPASSLLALLLSGITAWLYSASAPGKRKRILETVLGGRVSRKVFHQLMDNPRSANFSGKNCEITTLTCRLLNRPELAENASPSEFVKLTNLYRRVVTRNLLAHDAYIDEAGPEILRAHFGLLPNSEDHAQLACRAALDLRNRFRSSGSQPGDQDMRDMEIGIGIETGPVVAGIYGSRQNFFLSAIGAVTDFGRRLSSANLRYGSDILLGPAIYKKIHSHFTVRPMEMFYDPETDSLLEIYQLIEASGSSDDEVLELCQHFWKGVVLYREENYTAAIESFSKARIPGREDGPLEFFLRECREKHLAANGEIAIKPELTGKGHSRLLGQL